jgi:hypothetical protein
VDTVPCFLPHSSLSAFARWHYHGGGGGQLLKPNDTVFGEATSLYHLPLYIIISLP